MRNLKNENQSRTRWWFSARIIAIASFSCWLDILAGFCYPWQFSAIYAGAVISCALPSFIDIFIHLVSWFYCFQRRGALRAA